MKVIRIDNYDRETVSDCLVAENLSNEAALKKAAELNAKENPLYSNNYFVVKPDDYQLYKYEP